MEVKTVLTSEEITLIKERYKKTIKEQKFSFLENLRTVFGIVIALFGYFLCFLILYRSMVTCGTMKDNNIKVFMSIFMICLLTFLCKIFKTGYLNFLKYFPKNDINYIYQLSKQDIKLINHCVHLKEVLILFSSKKINRNRLFFVQKEYNTDFFNELANELKNNLSKSRLPRKYFEEV